MSSQEELITEMVRAYTSRANPRPFDMRQAMRDVLAVVQNRMVEPIEAERDAARRDAESLREKAELYLGDARRWQSAVMKAPHDPLCATRGELGPCNCWKRAAIDAARGPL